MDNRIMIDSKRSIFIDIPSFSNAYLVICFKSELLCDYLLVITSMYGDIIYIQSLPNIIIQRQQMQTQTQNKDTMDIEQDQTQGQHTTYFKPCEVKSGVLCFNVSYIAYLVNLCFDNVK